MARMRRRVSKASARNDVNRRSHGKTRGRRAAGSVADEMYNMIHRNKVKAKNRAKNRVARKSRQINRRHKR